MIYLALYDVGDIFRENEMMIIIYYMSYEPSNVHSSFTLFLAIYRNNVKGVFKRWTGPTPPCPDLYTTYFYYTYYFEFDFE